MELTVRGTEDAAGQDHVDRPAGDSQLSRDRDRHRGELVGKPVDEAARNRVTLGGNLEHEWRQLLEAAVAHPAFVDLARNVDRPSNAEPLRDPPGQGCRRAPPVAGTHGRRERLAPDPLPAAPVPRQVTDPGQPRRSPVGTDAGGVHPGTAHDDDAPALGSARAERREGIVVHRHAFRHT